MEPDDELRSPRILLVEDEVLIALDLAEKLSSSGYDVVSAPTGEEALAEADQTPPDLILVNIKLKGHLDGVQVAEAIRNRHDPAIIYLTAYAEKDLIERAQTTKPYGYLSKPVSTEELLRAVEATLYRHTMERRLRESERRLELALQGAEMGMWDWDFRTGKGYVSEGYLAMCGYSPGDVDTDVRTWKEYVHPDDWQSLSAALKAHLEGSAPLCEAEYRVKCKSGAWKWVLGRGKVFERDQENKPLRIVGTVLDVDARHHAQARLEESLELVRSVFSSLDEAVCVVNLATRTIVECNRAAEEIFGYASEELIGSSSRVLYGDDEAFRQFGEAVREALAMHAVYFGESRMRRKNGEVFPAERYIAPIHTAGGDIVHAVSVTRDVTRRKKDEENLARTTSLLEALTDVQSQFIARSDPQEIYEGLLGNLLKLTGSESGFINEQLIDESGMPYRQSRVTVNATEFCQVNPLTARRFYSCNSLVGAAVATGRAVISNDPARDPRAAGVPAGHPPLRSFLCLPLVARERLVGVVGLANRPGGYDAEMVEFLAPYVAMCANIIDAYREERLRKQAEEALREGEAKLRLITDALPAVIAYVDSEQRYRFINRTYELWTGRKAENLIGRTVQECWPADEYELIRPHIEQALAGEVQAYEQTLGLKNLPAREVSTTYIPHVDERGQVRGFAALFADVTEQKTTEKRITAALAEKEILLREIHHRVKNNLAVISSLINLQAAHATDDFHRQMFRDVQTRVRSMAIAHEKLYQSENLSKLGMQAYLRSLVDHMTVSSGSIGSPVRLVKSVDDIALGLDTAVPVGFIVTELVSNSLKHAFPSGGYGEIAVALRSIGGNQYELIVADNGVGLPQEFDLDGLKTLGLALVRTFAAQLNGRVEIRRGRGAEFRVVFEEVPKSAAFDQSKAD